MNIAVERVDQRRHRTLIHRDDGVRFELLRSRPEETMPHCLSHAVVESRLGIADGLWGTIAEGGILPGMKKLSGRERPDADIHSLSVLRANRRSLVTAELLVDVLMKALRPDGTGDTRQALIELSDRATESVHVVSGSYKELFVDLHSMRDRWTFLPVGDRIEIGWPWRIPDGRNTP